MTQQFNIDSMIAEMNRDLKYTHSQPLSGIGQAFNEIIATLGLDKIKSYQQNQQGQAQQNTLKDWKQNKK